MFRARLPPTSHRKRPRLARNLHLVTTSRSPDYAIRNKHATQHNTSEVLRLPEKMQHLLTTSQKYSCQAKRFSTHIHMPRSATPAARNEATYVTLETSKNDPSCRIYYTLVAITRTVANCCEWLCGRLRTVANGCEQLRNVQLTNLHPQTPRVKQEPLLRIME